MILISTPTNVYGAHRKLTPEFRMVLIAVSQKLNVQNRLRISSQQLYELTLNHTTHIQICSLFQADLFSGYFALTVFLLTLKCI